MRIHRVEKYLDDFERLHERLASELIILPNFPEGGELSALFGKSGFVGKSMGQWVDVPRVDALYDTSYVKPGSLEVCP